MSRTGHTRTVFYRHFDDVPSLVLALMQEVGAELVELAQEWAQTEPRRARRGAASASRRSSTSTSATARSSTPCREAAHHDEVVEQAYDGDGRGLRAS